MSVRTAADEHVAATKDQVREALKSLSQILIDKCWGSDELSNEYQAKLFEAFQGLVNVLKLL